MSLKAQDVTYSQRAGGHIAWVDWAKIIGIYFVILGHGSLMDANANIYIYSFHMPFFFMLSGMLYKKRDLPETFKKSIKTLIIPYLIISLICFLYYTVVDYLVNSEFSISMVYHRVGAILMGLGYATNNWEPVSQPMWFIIALFFMQIAMSLSSYHKYGEYILLVVSLLFYVILQFFKIDTYPPFDSAAIAFPFFFVGYKMKNWLLNEDRKMNAVPFVLFLLWLILATFNGRVDVCHCDYGNSLILFYLTGFIGSFMLVMLCQKIKVGGAELRYSLQAQY